MALSAEKFAQGMTTDQYIDIIKVNKDPFQQIHAGGGDSGQRAGLLQRTGAAGEPGRFHLRLVRRRHVHHAGPFSGWPTPATTSASASSTAMTNWNCPTASCPSTGRGTVPIFVVFDENMGEIARFIETARSLVPAIDAMDEMVAQAAAAITDEAESRQQARGRRTAHRVGKAAEWGAVILNEFQQVVADGMALPATDRPAEGGTEWPPQD